MIGGTCKYEPFVQHVLTGVHCVPSTALGLGGAESLLVGCLPPNGRTRKQ